MTPHEDIARQRLYLVHDNPDLRTIHRPSIWERLSYLAQLAMVAIFVLGCWWAVAVLFLSLEK